MNQEGFPSAGVRNEVQRGEELQSSGDSCPSWLLPAAEGLGLWQLFITSTKAPQDPGICLDMGCWCLDTQIAPKWPHSPWGEGKLWPFVKGLIFPQGTGSNWSFMIKYFFLAFICHNLCERRKKCFQLKATYVTTLFWMLIHELLGADSAAF